MLVMCVSVITRKFRLAARLDERTIRLERGDDHSFRFAGQILAHPQQLNLNLASFLFFLSTYRTRQRKRKETENRILIPSSGLIASVSTPPKSLSRFLYPSLSKSIQFLIHSLYRTKRSFVAAFDQRRRSSNFFLDQSIDKLDLKFPLFFSCCLLNSKLNSSFFSFLLSFRLSPYGCH